MNSNRTSRVGSDHSQLAVERAPVAGPGGCRRLTRHCHPDHAGPPRARGFHPEHAGPPRPRGQPTPASALGQRCQMLAECVAEVRSLEPLPDRAAGSFRLERPASSRRSPPGRDRQSRRSPRRFEERKTDRCRRGQCPYDWTRRTLRRAESNDGRREQPSIIEKKDPDTQPIPSQQSTGAVGDQDLMSCLWISVLLGGQLS
jgi:hypothetical protein